eukprot:TRINITY_DN8536_c0_g1_i1.p1 TRINITY_DN8536_c0_g1~~TRINITY_DN8536_c0_g1_i1.p1  ORF type:complete len:185 (+),score=52.98 TRINITY_DN8536_c0_g1_i1:64-618(+)
MGNELCVAGGGTPMQVDILVVNNTEIPLALDLEQDCQRDCHHKGWQVAAGKIVEGREPPEIIDAFSDGKFSASGREGAQVAPNGKVYYKNEDVNLKVAICWSCAGWTSPGCSNSATISITGKQEDDEGLRSIFRSDPKPWSELIAADIDTENWVVTLRPRERGDDWRKMIKTIAGGKFTIAKAH